MKLVVDLDDGLVARLRRLVPDHDRDRFVNEVVTEKVAALEKKLGWQRRLEAQGGGIE